jgi:hypothetical protein
VKVIHRVKCTWTLYKLDNLFFTTHSADSITSVQRIVCKGADAQINAKNIRSLQRIIPASWSCTVLQVRNPVYGSSSLCQHLKTKFTKKKISTYRFCVTERWDRFWLKEWRETTPLNNDFRRFQETWKCSEIEGLTLNHRILIIFLWSELVCRIPLVTCLTPYWGKT